MTIDHLMLDRVLQTGTGDALCCAIACVEAARRVGLPLGIVADEHDRPFIAHRGLDQPLLLAPAAPDRLIDANLLTADALTWRCSHQLALMLLDEVIARATRSGRHGTALCAGRLRLALPVDEPTLETLTLECAQLAARLN
jgi:hypothetical protein